MSDNEELGKKLDRLIELQTATKKGVSDGWGDHAMKIATGLISLGMVWMITTVSDLDTVTQLQAQSIDEMNDKLDNLKEATGDRFTKTDWEIASAKGYSDVEDLQEDMVHVEELIEELDKRIDELERKVD